MSFDVFNQEVSTLDVDMNSMDQIEEPPFELEPESPAKKWAWRYGEDCECPSEGNFSPTIWSLFRTRLDLRR